jgi:hypothetical protein
VRKSKNRILYLPVIDGIRRIESLFLGPVEVPEEIFIKKAEKDNKRGG